MGIETRSRALTIPGLLALSVMVCACGGQTVPDPRLASEAYAKALRLGDVTALHAMLDSESRRAVTPGEVKAIFTGSQAELRRRAEAFSKRNVRVEASADIVFADGERVRLRLEDGRYRIQAAASLPSGARTPIDALSELRAVLARRSYAGLVRVLSSDSAGALEQQLRDLVQSLEQPETLRIDLDGGEATVSAPGGHRVILKREEGVWKVHDFE